MDNEQKSLDETLEKGKEFAKDFVENLDEIVKNSPPEKMSSEEIFDLFKYDGLSVNIKKSEKDFLRSITEFCMNDVSERVLKHIDREGLSVEDIYVTKTNQLGRYSVISFVASSNDHYRGVFRYYIECVNLGEDEVQLRWDFMYELSDIITEINIAHGGSVSARSEFPWCEMMMEPRFEQPDPLPNIGEVSTETGLDVEPEIVDAEFTEKDSKE